MFTVGSTCLYSKVKVGEEVLKKCRTPHPYKGEKGVVWEKTFTVSLPRPAPDGS
jgi:hypothetical protein